MNTANEPAPNAQALPEKLRRRGGFLSTIKDMHVTVDDVPLVGILKLEATEKGATFVVLLSEAAEFLAKLTADVRRHRKPPVSLSWRDGITLTYREPAMTYSLMDKCEPEVKPTTVRFHFASSRIEVRARVKAAAPRVDLPVGLDPALLRDGMTFG